MTIETLNKANQLNNDLRTIKYTINEHKERYAVYISTPHSSGIISDRLQEELVEFLKQKQEQYTKELEEL